MCVVALFKMESTPTNPPLGANHSTTHPVQKIKGETVERKENTGDRPNILSVKRENVKTDPRSAPLADLPP